MTMPNVYKSQLFSLPYPFEKGSLAELGAGWWPASANHPPVSTLPVLGLQALVTQPFPSAGIYTWGLIPVQ